MGRPHHLAGKKQWTWGDAPFGHAWDANLTDTDGPYVELMAGVYTDNQPDFSFLEPGETKTFSQFWYPISGIGPAMQATREAAIRVDVPEPGTLRIGVATSVVAEDSAIRIESADGSLLTSLEARLTPDAPVILDWTAPSGTDAATLRVAVVNGDHELVRFARRPADTDGDAPAPAVAPPAPQDVATTEELDLIGDYLDQYRHATRSPEPYWQEALRRDPGTSERTSRSEHADMPPPPTTRRSNTYRPRSTARVLGTEPVRRRRALQARARAGACRACGGWSSRTRQGHLERR